MIQLIIDGHPVKSESNNLQDLLEKSEEVRYLLEKKYAIVINQSFVPKSEYAMTLLKDKDHIEFFTPIEGG